MGTSQHIPNAFFVATVRVCMHVCMPLSVHVCVSVCTYVSMSLCVFVYLCVCLMVCLCMYVSVCVVPLCVCISVSVWEGHMCLCVSLCVHLCMFMCLCICVHVFVCMCLYLSVLRGTLRYASLEQRQRSQVGSGVPGSPFTTNPSCSLTQGWPVTLYVDQVGLKLTGIHLPCICLLYAGLTGPYHHALPPYLLKQDFSH